MARYDNEKPPYIPNPQADPAPAPKPEEKQEEKNESSFGGGGGYGGGSITVVPRREWLPKYHFNGGEKQPPHYRHEDYGHEKEQPKKPKKLGGSYGIGAIPRSPLPKGVTSITVFQPEILMSANNGWDKPAMGVRFIQDAMIERGIPWWEDKKKDVTAAANLSVEDATNMCLSNNVPSFIHISFGEAWDSFHTIHYVKDRIGMKKKKEHRITGINPAEVLDKVQSTLGMTVPKIPSDIVKESSGEKV